MESMLEPAAFSGLVDLAAERVGGKALLASDEFFAEKENLLKPGRGVFIADKYTDRGKWMDGWESRRKRTPGHDWCILRLGLPGVIQGFDIDTHHFLGNHPPYASVDALRRSPATRAASPWPRTPRGPRCSRACRSRPGRRTCSRSPIANRWTHLRLNIFPDGGVARFRVYGRVVPDWSRVDAAGVDRSGGRRERRPW